MWSLARYFSIICANVEELRLLTHRVNAWWLGYVCWWNHLMNSRHKTNCMQVLFFDNIWIGISRMDWFFCLLFILFLLFIQLYRTFGFDWKHMPESNAQIIQQIFKRSFHSMVNKVSAMHSNHHFRKHHKCDERLTKIFDNWLCFGCTMWENMQSTRRTLPTISCIAC